MVSSLGGSSDPTKDHWTHNWGTKQYAESFTRMSKDGKSLTGKAMKNKDTIDPLEEWCMSTVDQLYREFGKYSG